MNSEFRCGIGYDSHRLQRGRRLVLGGIEIPFEKGLAGHSDADIVIHAITDALLGAAGLGDIGQHFPSSDPRWKDAPSAEFLKRARELLGQHGCAVVHIDVVVVIEQPKLLPYRDAICREVAELLGIDAGRVSLKAKTAEGLGPIGRGEAAEAHAVATIRSSSQP